MITNTLERLQDVQLQQSPIKSEPRRDIRLRSDLKSELQSEPTDLERQAESSHNQSSSQLQSSVRSSRFRESERSSDSRLKVSLKNSMRRLDGKKLKFMRDSTFDRTNELMELKLKDVMAIVQG